MDILIGTIGEVDNNSIKCIAITNSVLLYCTLRHSYLSDNPKYILVDSDKYASGGYAITEKLYSIIITKVNVNYIIGVEVGMVLDVLHETDMEMAIYYAGFINSHFVTYKECYEYERIYDESNFEFIDGL